MSVTTRRRAVLAIDTTPETTTSDAVVTLTAKKPSAGLSCGSLNGKLPAWKTKAVSSTAPTVLLAPTGA